MSKTSKAVYVQVAICLGLFVLSTFFLNSKRTTNPYYFDEVSWICNGRVYQELVNGRVKSHVWTEDLVQKLNPQLAKYLLGFWVDAKYGRAGFSTFGCPSWGRLMLTSGLEELTPRQREILVYTRIPMMIAGSISIVLIYVLGKVLFSTATGLLSAALLLLNPLFQVSVNRAMPDALLMAFLLLSLLIAAYYFKKGTRIADIWTSLLWGILGGIAISIKPYGGILLVFFII